MISVQAFKVSYVHRKHGCLLNPVDNNRVNQRLMEEIVLEKRFECQSARQSKVNSLPLHASTGKQACKHVLQRDSNAANDVRTCIAVPQHPAALGQAVFRWNRLVFQGNRLLKRPRLAIHINSASTSQGVEFALNDRPAMVRWCSNAARLQRPLYIRIRNRFPGQLTSSHGLP